MFDKYFRLIEHLISKLIRHKYNDLFILTGLLYVDLQLYILSRKTYIHIVMIVEQ